MGRGAILPPVSIVARPPAALADTAPRTTVRIPIPPVHGTSTAMPSTAEARLVPAAARRPMTMPTTVIPMAHGPERTIRSTSARKPALPAAILAMNTLTTPTRTVTASATIAARPSL